MNDALKILGTLLVAGFLTLALTNTSVSDVAASTRQNLALQTVDNTYVNSNTFAIADNNDGTSRFVAVNTENTQLQNRVIDNRNIYNNKENVLINTNGLRVNDGIYANNTDYDNQRVITRSTDNVINNVNRDVVVPGRTTAIGTASAVNTGIQVGSRFGLWVLFFALLGFAVFLYRATSHKRDRLGYYGYGYAPIAPYYDVPALHEDPHSAHNAYYDNGYGYDSEPMNYPETTAATEGDSKQDTPEYRINLN